MGEIVDNLIVLGQIPGTNVIINFQVWLYSAYMLLAFVIVYLTTHRLRTLNDDVFQPMRVPLHATQLHQRAG